MSLLGDFNTAAAPSPPIDRQAMGRELLALAARPMDGNSQNLNLTVRAETLVHTGADLEVTDDNGRTPLLCAAKSGRLRILDAIIAGGANTRHRDKDGATARDLVARKNKKIIQSLEKAEEKLKETLRQEARDTSSRRDFSALRPLKVHKRKPRPRGGQGQGQGQV
ncbi:MAG: hypothetical protein Q8K65_05050 [Alphaproteobacteria bacterium]|nr:hypothetical protein [Alphaproteobacteria bacterium]